MIFRCENAPDSQTGHGAGISQNIRAVFSRISAIFGVGNPSREDSLRRRSGAGKRAGSLPVLWGILDPQNRLFPVSPYSSPSERRSASQKGIIRPVFLPSKLAISDSRPVYVVSENRGSKVPQYDRLPKTGQKVNMPELSPDCHFEPYLVYEGSVGPKRGGQGQSHLFVPGEIRANTFPSIEKELSLLV